MPEIARHFILAGRQESRQHTHPKSAKFEAGTQERNIRNSKSIELELTSVGSWALASLEETGRKESNKQFGEAA